MSDRNQTQRQLAAGVIDAGLASLATFAAGITGVALLGDVDRGVYGVFFTAFFLGSVIVTELTLVPAQVVAVGLPAEKRLSVTRRSLMLALAPGLVGVLAAVAAGWLQAGETSRSVIVALLTTTAVMIVVSPMQDHVRQLLHIADRSWHAVIVSALQLVGVGTGIGVLWLLDVERAWIPFGSLAAANIVSLTVGTVLARAPRSDEGDSLRFAELATSGKWLLIRAATPATLAFLAANIISELAGLDVYGYAEAARQVAQPITVLSVGLMAILGPRAVRAGSLGDVAGGARNRRSFVSLMLAAGVLYAAVIGFDWALNPMAWLVPAAYVVGGLVIATIVANVLAAVFLIYGRELLGAGQARSLAVISLIASPALPLAALTAGGTEAFARPIGYIIEGAVRTVGGRWWLRRHYSTTGSEPVPAATLTHGTRPQ